MFINNIEVIAKGLKDEFDIQTKDIQHNPSKGTMREDSLKDALRKIVPVKYEFGSGTVVDAHGVQSRQQDFLLYDAFSSPTFLKKQSSLVLPIESIYAAIEVKSTISNQELEKAVKNFDSLMSLEKNTINSFIPITGNNSIMGLVFAYTSNSSLETLTNRMIELNESLPVNHRIGCVCVLDKGNIVNVLKDDIRTLSTLSSEKTTLIIKENDLEQNFYLFYLLLQSHLNYSLNLPPDLWRYAKISGYFKDKGMKMTSRAITDDVILDLDHGITVTGAEHKRYWKMHEYIYKSLMGVLSEEDIQQSGMNIDEFSEELKWAADFHKKQRNAFLNSSKADKNLQSLDSLPEAEDIN